MEPKEIKVSLSVEQGCLTVTAEAPINPPSKHSFINFLKQGMTNIMPAGITSVVVHGKVQGLGAIAWHQQFSLQTDSPTAELHRTELQKTELQKTELQKTELQKTEPKRLEFQQQECPQAEPRSFITPEQMEHFSRAKLTPSPGVNLSSYAPRRSRAQEPPQIRYFLWATSLMLGALLSAHIVTWFMPRSVARTEWEYHIVTLEDDNFDTAIKKLGQEGWELSYARRAIASESDTEYTLYELILKRPK
ncbi:MAG: hypothetical protein HC857_11955 [Synechococcales cyanobacterium RU_4_20]|nr:hypothetical protein [Synechococcales cyanobacterium RU_4_20]